MNKTRGFTLIELMVTVAIVGLLAAIALPSYRDSVRKSHRADAQISLSSLATQQEKFYFRTNNYTDDFADLATGVAAGTDTIESNEGYYDITLVAGADLRSWSMTAAPKGAQADDSACAAITLTNTGVKTAKDSADASNMDCWK